MLTLNFCHLTVDRNSKMLSIRIFIKLHSTNRIENFLLANVSGCSSNFDHSRRLKVTQLTTIFLTFSNRTQLNDNVFYLLNLQHNQEKHLPPKGPSSSFSRLPTQTQGRLRILQLDFQFSLKVFLNSDHLAITFKFLRVCRSFNTITSNSGNVLPAVVGNLERKIQSFPC